MGGRFDTHLIAAIMYANQDVLVGGFGSKSTILSQLSETPRSMSPGEFAGNLTLLGIDAPPTEWTRFIVESDYPQDYFTLFAAFVATVVSLILPWNITSFIITQLCHLIVPDSSDFMVNKYLPALGENVKNFSLSMEESIGVAAKFSAVLIKIVWAFMWQEEQIPDSFLWNEVGLSIAVAITPYVYKVADALSGFYEQDYEVNTLGNVFPGDKFCRTDSPHALWHEISGNALINFAYLANHVNGLSKHYTMLGKQETDLSDPMTMLSVAFDMTVKPFY